MDEVVDLAAQFIVTAATLQSVTAEMDTASTVAAAPRIDFSLMRREPCVGNEYAGQGSARVVGTLVEISCNMFLVLYPSSMYGTCLSTSRCSSMDWP